MGEKMSDETKDLPPGPELDALVAEKVLGLSVIWDYPMGMEHPLRFAALYAGGYKDSLPPYSTDLTTCAAAAEEARKAGKIDGWTIESPYAGRPLTALVYVDRRIEPDDISAAQGETLAHSLALALLRAVEG